MFTSLAAVTGTGAGSSWRGNPSSDFSFQVICTGSPTAVVVDVEGSLDGHTYSQVTQHTFSAGEITAGTALFHLVQSPLAKVRLNLTTLTGGSSPTVTGLILNKEDK